MRYAKYGYVHRDISIFISILYKKKSVASKKYIPNYKFVKLSVVVVFICFFYYLLVFRFLPPFSPSFSRGTAPHNSTTAGNAAPGGFIYACATYVLPFQRSSERDKMGHQQLYWSHPRKFGQGSRSWSVLLLPGRY